MLQAFIIVLREGFEAFLIAAVIVSYLQKTNQRFLIPAVQGGIALSLLLSATLGYFILQGLNQPLWEGIFGLVTAVLVGGFIVHMWKTAPHLKADMEKKLTEISRKPSTKAEWIGVFAFTLFMISREGMETALMLIQVHSAEVISGSVLGVFAAIVLAFAWMKLGHLINLKRFFQVTALFFVLFIVQMLIYSFHEFIEAGVIQSEYWNNATEPFSPQGIYGKWISLGMVLVCGAWLVVSGIRDAMRKRALS